MSTPFQNRLVGTIIIAALAVIFLPDILDGDKKTYQQEFAPIPALPVTDVAVKGASFPEQKLAQLPSEKLSLDIAIDEQKPNFFEQAAKQANDAEAGLPQQTKVKNSAGDLEVKTLSSSTKNHSVKADKPQVDNAQTKLKTLPEQAIAAQAWVVQLGSFRHKKNVNELVEKLNTHGYTVFTRPITTKNGTLTKVFVGPELIKSSLEKKLITLNKLTGVKGKIARFHPTKK